LASPLFQKKSLDRILSDAQKPEHQLRRVLGPVSLTALGIGAIIGAGIFATTGTAAAGDAMRVGAGPGLILSYFLTALACGFCALCYAELAAMIPISGSAYTYAYATLGEFVAWVIGWDLILEYAVGNVAVAVSWSGYFVDLLRGFGIELPRWLTTNYNTAMRSPEILASAPRLFGVPMFFNLPAVAIVAGITVLLVIGIKESSNFNSMMVAIKLVVVIGFVVVGVKYVRPEHWQPFMPNGWTGVLTGASLVFFAYIGFDAVSTTAEEARNPQRDLPTGMIASLIICTILYVAVTAVLTGIVPYKELGTAEPLSTALRLINLNWASGIVSFGAVIAMTAVLLVFQMGQPRIFFSMSRDGLLPRKFASVHPRFRTPHVTTILTGVGVASFAAFVDINSAVEFTNIGTLFAFILVAIGVIVLRYIDPHRTRPFRCPGSPVLPFLSIISCVVLMAYLPWITWLRFVLWFVVGIAIFFLYSRRNSKLCFCANCRRGVDRRSVTCPDCDFDLARERMKSLVTDNTIGFGVSGTFVGALIAFFLRPAATLVGQLPLEHVLTRGAKYRGLDQVLAPIARTSFNHLVVGIVIGAVIGALIGYWISKWQKLGITRTASDSK
jgi:APA family basic amino acid/polyamine antiporter